MAELHTGGFHFDPLADRIDWSDDRCLALANPTWLGRDPGRASAAVAALPGRPGHLWIATSGSTAASDSDTRWVGLSRAALLASAAAVNRHLESDRRDVWIHALPVFHVGGLGILARAWLAGASVAAGVSGRWDAFRFRARADEVRASLTALVPSQVHDLVAAGLRAPASLRAVVVGGARLDPELCRDARALGWPCLPSYGLTETGSQIATASLGEGHLASCSCRLPVLDHAEVRLSDDERLEVRGESLLTCYAEVSDAGVREWDPKIDGWFATEDLARVEEGLIEVLGRVSDSVKVLGEMVSLTRVEAAVKRWAAAEPLLAALQPDAALVALPHERLGHELVAVLAAHGRAATGAGVEELTRALDAFCRDQLLPFERVQRVVWVERIPRTALGKCQRSLLARQVLLQSRANL